MKNHVITLKSKVYIYGFTLFEVITMSVLVFFSLLEYLLLHFSVLMYFVVLYAIFAVRLEKFSCNLWQFCKRVLDYYILRKQEY